MATAANEVMATAANEVMATAANACTSKPTEEVKALADSGDAEAQLELGYRHHTGRNAVKDVSLAFDCFLAAAAAG